MTEETRSTLPGAARSPVQPNDAGGNRLIGFSWRFWILVGLTGVGAGLGGGLLMMLLRAVQHVASRVLSVAAAGDLMTPVEPLSPALSKAEALARLAAEPAGELPVVDAAGRLLGVAATPKVADRRSSA